jgi:hypothetical protein
MMEDAAAIDQVKSPLQPPKFEDVGLLVFNVGNSELLGHPGRIGEARPAQVDRKNLGIWLLSRVLDGKVTGAATGNEHGHWTRADANFPRRAAPWRICFRLSRVRGIAPSPTGDRDSPRTARARPGIRRRQSA